MSVQECGHCQHQDKQMATLPALELPVFAIASGSVGIDLGMGAVAYKACFRMVCHAGFANLISYACLYVNIVCNGCWPPRCCCTRQSR